MQKLALGIIGAGGIARRKTIPAILKAANCEIRAVMDIAGAAEIAAEFNIAKSYETVDELLNDPKIAAVYIASPVFCHHDHVVAAAKHQKHVLCEKPLARSFTEAESLVAACRAHDVYLQEGYMMKFHGAHCKIRELIDDGALGKIVSMRAQLSCWYPPMPGAWRQTTVKGGGGALIDMATHLYDLLEYFAGPIRRLATLTGNLVHDYDPEDAATTLLEFESGAHATVDCFYCIPDEASRTRLEVYGSQGSIYSEGTIGQSVGGELEASLLRPSSRYDATQNKDCANTFNRIAFEAVNPYTEEFEYFADCVLNNRPPEINNAENGLHIMRLTEAAYASALKHRFVDVAR